MQEQKKQVCFTVNELRQVMKQSPENLVIVDVRKPEEFAEQHIPGAINIPLGELDNHIKDLNGKEKIITVCTKGGGRSEEGVIYLDMKGIKGATFLCGGTKAWYEDN
jgi:rhodanese-related sulfurtransferase